MGERARPFVEIFGWISHGAPRRRGNLAKTQDELRDAVLLVFANKQDLPNAMNAAEITDKLTLHSLRQRHWCARACLGNGGRDMRALRENVHCESALRFAQCTFLQRSAASSSRCRAMWLDLCA